MLWVKASMPVPAVRCGGRLMVSSGSISASFGMRCGLPIASLRPESMMMTPPRLTSLPVPEVVGMATIGATFAVILRRAALDHRIGLQRVARMRRHQRHALGEIHRRAAADRDDAVAALGLVHRERVAHRRFGRVLRRAVIDRERHVAGQMLLHLGPQAGGDHALVGDDQRPAHAEQLQLRLEQLQRAEVELDAGEIGDQSHETLPFCASVREKNSMSDTLVLRAGTLADATAIAATIAAAFEQYRGKLVPESGAFAETADNIAGQLRSGAGAIVAERNGADARPAS